MRLCLHFSSAMQLFEADEAKLRAIRNSYRTV